MLVAETKSEKGADQPSVPASRPLTWKEIVEPVEPFLSSVAKALESQVQAFDPKVVPFAQYALTNQGKQLRPTLVALAGSAVGKANENMVTVAVIIEMIHLATLVHDDIMDSASMRRRRPTLAANWGNEISVLLGDCLFAQALKLASGFPTTEVCRSVATATKTVCSGEILQTLHRTQTTYSREEYFKVIGMKTGELFALSCDLGSWLAGATPRQREQLREFGLALGTAYQIYDDCVDLFGLEARAGKSLGTDLANGKVTLPVLVCLERAEKAGNADFSELQGMIRKWDHRFLNKMLGLMDKYGALAESKAVIHEILGRAQHTLVDLPDTSGRLAISGLADFLEAQTKALGPQTKLN